MIVKYLFVFILSVATLYGCGCTDDGTQDISIKVVEEGIAAVDQAASLSLELLGMKLNGSAKAAELEMEIYNQIINWSKIENLNLSAIIFEMKKQTKLME